MKITVGGEELTLTRPKGRAGRAFIARIQKALELVAPMAASYQDVDAGNLTMDQVGPLLAVSSDLFLKSGDDIQLEDELLPGLYVWSSAGLTKDEALAKLDEIEDTPMELANTLMLAAVYWIRPDVEDREALEEAQKKSPAAEEAGKKK